MIGRLVRAELFQLRRRPVVWIVGGAWLLDIAGLAYAVPYLVYRSTRDDLLAQGRDPEAALVNLLPQSVAGYSVSLYALFGAAFMLILGAVSIGNEYRWRTLGTLFIQGPGRGTVLAVKGAALALALLVVTAASIAVCALCGVLVARAENRPVHWPPVSTMVGSLGASWLGALAFAGVGFALALLLRGTAAALGVGLVWALGLENAIGGLAGVVPGLNLIRTVLMGPSVGSLAVGLGASPQGQGGTPGVVNLAPPGVAVAVLSAYVVVALGLGILAVRRRDLN